VPLLRPVRRLDGLWQQDEPPGDRGAPAAGGSDPKPVGGSDPKPVGGSDPKPVGGSDPKPVGGSDAVAASERV
jgi:hypothetical protein